MSREIRGNPAEGKLSIENRGGGREAGLVLDIIEKQLSFPSFLEVVRLTEPPQLGKEGGIKKFEKWPHLMELVKALISEKQIVVLKSRQVGASWLIAAYSVWLGMSKYGSEVLLFSKGELEAKELLKKCRRVYMNLPEHMKIKADPDSATELAFPVMGSSIKVLAATESAGVSFTSSLVVCDEWDEHPHAEENFAASKPTRDAGGQFVGIFTASRPDPDTLAKAVFREAQEGVNGFKAFFFPWGSRPGRTQEWYDEVKRSIPARELAKLTPELYMARNYPLTAEEALRPPQASLAFDVEVLEEMMKQTWVPLRLEGFDWTKCNIWQPPYMGERYIAASDTSHGVGLDYSATVIMDARSGLVVADILSNVLSLEEFTFYTVKLLRLYDAFWFPEDNEWGSMLINLALRMGGVRIGYRDEKRTRPGFHSDERSLLGLWGELILAINSRQIKIPNALGLAQFKDIIRNIAKGGKIEAVRGRHDDYPITVGMCWLHRHRALSSSSPHSLSRMEWRE